MDYFHLALTVTVILFTLIGFAVPFLQVAHARHARAFMAALVGLTALWVLLYEYVLARVPQAHVSDRLDVVLLRGYVFNAALCSLLEETFSMRDEEKGLRPLWLVLYVLFFLSALAFFAVGVFGA